MPSCGDSGNREIVTVTMGPEGLREAQMLVHWGYSDGEVPAYDPCEECGSVLRSDRLDLLMEHECVCSGETELQRRRAIRKLSIAAYLHGRAV